MSDAPEKTLTTARPDWIACVKDTHADRSGVAWCGRPLVAFAFADADHAAQNGRGGGRLVTCPDCANALVTALNHGQKP
jgi:hypothetical protein